MATVTITEKDITIFNHGSGRAGIKNLYEYTTQRYANKAPNGKHKGIIAVKRLKALTDSKRKKFHDTIKILVDRNYYSQDRRSYVYKAYKNGRFYSDCSSSGMATLEKIGYDFPWLFNTAAIYESDLFETVNVKIKKGHITNPKKLKVGDAILYIGNDPERPKQIGHVAWVYTVPAVEIPKSTTGKSKYKGGFPKLPLRGFFTLGDEGEEVKKLQKLCNWITGDKISPDGIFGKVTLATVKRAQVILKISDKPAGNFGPSSLEAAKKYEK